MTGRFPRPGVPLAAWFPVALSLAAILSFSALAGAAPDSSAPVVRLEMDASASAATPSGSGDGGGNVGASMSASTPTGEPGSGGFSLGGIDDQRLLPMGLPASAGVAPTLDLEHPVAPEPGPLDRPEVQAAAGAAGALGVAGVDAALGGRAFLAPLLPLYSRLDRGELLNHPVRRDLMTIIGREPGVNISDLHGRFDLGWGSLLYHLRRLEAQGLIVSHRWGRSRRYFLNQRHVEARAEGIRALKAENARALAEVISSHPGRTQEELAVHLGLSKSVVSKYARRLEDASLVQRQVGRNCLRLFPTGELKELLHAMPAAPAVVAGTRGPGVPSPDPVRAAGGLPPAMETPESREGADAVPPADAIAAVLVTKAYPAPGTSSSEPTPDPWHEGRHDETLAAQA